MWLNCKIQRSSAEIQRKSTRKSHIIHTYDGSTTEVRRKYDGTYDGSTTEVRRHLRRKYAGTYDGHAYGSRTEIVHKYGNRTEIVRKSYANNGNPTEIQLKPQQKRGSTEIQRNSTEIQRNSTEIQRNSTEIQRKSHGNSYGNRT